MEREAAIECLQKQRSGRSLWLGVRLAVARLDDLLGLVSHFAGVERPMTVVVEKVDCKKLEEGFISCFYLNVVLAGREDQISHVATVLSGEERTEFLDSDRVERCSYL